MEIYKAQIIESVVALVGFILLRLITRKIVQLFTQKSTFKLSERKEVIHLINLLLLVVFCIVLVSIWSVKQENVLIFVSSLLTVFGVALFAEMSILSNITACLILFFQHPIKVGDVISISHEGKDIEGEIIDITYFFVFIKTENRGTQTIPNALLIKSSFLLIEKDIEKKQ
jgi:small-conductance mechanosensitive channel